MCRRKRYAFLLHSPPHIFVESEFISNRRLIYFVSMESEGDEESSPESSHGTQKVTVTSETTVSVKSNVPPRRSAKQLWLHAALMCGRDFLYAVEVVLVTPIMLQLGMPEYLYSYIWFISPTFGLLLGPLIGNWSDKCSSPWGRRRPFILGFVVGTLVGLTLMIFSKDLAASLSDISVKQRNLGLVFGIAGTQIMDFCLDQLEAPLRAYTLDVCSPADQQRAFTLQSLAMGTGAALGYIIDGVKWNLVFDVEIPGIQIQVVYAFAVVIYVSMAIMTLTSIKETRWKRPRKNIKSRRKNWKAERRVTAREASSEPAIIDRPHLQTPSDINTAQHNVIDVRPSTAVRSITVLPRMALCKSVFLAMSCPEGLNDTNSSESNITTTSLTSVEENASADDMMDTDIYVHSLPNLSETSQKPRKRSVLDILKSSFSTSAGNLIANRSDPQIAQTEKSCENTVKESDKQTFLDSSTEKMGNLEFEDIQNSQHIKSEAVIVNRNTVVRNLEFEEKPLLEGKFSESRKRKVTRDKNDEGEAKPVSTHLLWLSIVTMPAKLRFLCFSLLISFMGIEIEMLWYTNIFGSVIYGGDPAAPSNSTELQLYNDGVHMACWGLTIYAVAVMIFSVALEQCDILTKVSLRLLYGGGQLVTALSTIVMFLFPTEIVMLMLSWTFGITVTTTLIIPYILVGKYHQDKEFVMKSPGATKRGFGTDCAILACQMYAGNLLYAAVSGPVIYSYGGVKIMLLVASACHALAFVICVWFVTYPGERNFKFCSRKSRTNNVNAEA